MNKVEYTTETRCIVLGEGKDGISAELKHAPLWVEDWSEQPPLVVNEDTSAVPHELCVNKPFAHILFR